MSYDPVRIRDYPEKSSLDLQHLHNAWDIVWLEAKGEEEAHSFYDTVDGPRTRSLDEIDARGLIPKKVLEAKLRSMDRYELEDYYGISPNKISEIIHRADVKKNGKIHYRDFLRTIQNYRRNSEQAGKVKKVVRALAYAEEFTCWPPKLVMVAITVIETIFFAYHCIHLPSTHKLVVTWDGPVPYCSVLIYNPKRRWEVWRYLTYMCVHIGIGHFVFNMIMQLIVGVVLEMQQEGWLGSLRVLAVYASGVVAGALGTSVSEPDTFIAGASGGVYALIAAHLATLILNWKEDSAVKIRKVIHLPVTRIIRLVFICTLVVHDVGLAIYTRYYSDEENTIGFMGHFCGALAGLLVGIFVLDNRRVRSWEPIVQYLSFTLFTVFIVFAIVWNIFGDQWYKDIYGKGRFYPKPNFELYNDASGNCKHYNLLWNTGTS